MSGVSGDAIAVLDSGKGTSTSKASTALVLLLSQGVLADQDAMAEVYHAIQHDRLVVPVYVHSRGYIYSEARKAILEFKASWMRRLPPQEADEVTTVLLDVITNTIAVDWRPDGGQNQTAAAIQEIMSRIAVFRNEHQRRQSLARDSQQSTLMAPRTSGGESKDALYKTKSKSRSPVILLARLSRVRLTVRARLHHERVKKANVV